MRRSGIGSLQSPLLENATSSSEITGEAVAARRSGSPLFPDGQAHVALGPGDEDGLGRVNGAPPAGMAITLVEDIGEARLDLDRSADLKRR